MGVCRSFLPSRAAKLSTPIRPRRAITAEAVLSFLSLGVDPTVPIWYGKLRRAALTYSSNRICCCFPDYSSW
ncbi:MAG TPA: hypothetical protein VLM90_12990 [Candidatus Deferrimicrobium sp.]|nr:hypothetical protein [Candidatus Deferrimicrobium sp.]